MPPAVMCHSQLARRAPSQPSCQPPRGSCLKALQNGPHFNKQTGEDEYSDSEFSQLYKNALWHDNVMRSAFLHNLDRLLTSRGFNVQRRSIFMPEAVSEASSDSLPAGLPEASSQASPEVEAEGTETLTMMSNTEADHPHRQKRKSPKGTCEANSATRWRKSRGGAKKSWRHC